MKEIKQYIQEKLIVNNTIDVYNYHPKTKQELIECIQDKIDKEGLGTKNKSLDLNDIDTSKITDMSRLFDAYGGDLINLSEKGNFDISEWDVSNVENMEYMFWKSNFNGNISSWDVSRVTSMHSMFYYSVFDGDISAWDVRNVEDMRGMFAYSGFNGNISNWDVSNVEDMGGMFAYSGFNGNISNWDVSNVEDMYKIFNGCPLQNNPPKWYK